MLADAGHGEVASFKNVMLAGAESAVLPNTQNLVCVTVYNEGLSALLATLHSLMRALVSARRMRLCSADDSCIALMLDGQEKVNTEVLGFLVEAGLIVAPNVDGTHFFFSRLTGSALLRKMSHDKDPDMDAEMVRVVVCLKDRNRGKLHSHALFFGNLCTRFAPRYCFQIDAGTTVEESAITEMLQHFQRCPEAGALASRVVSQLPNSADGVLKNWQFMSFSMQCAVAWPAEMCSGHLSVLPGQFCAFRWTTLMSSRRCESLHAGLSPDEYPGVRSDALAQPLDGYLRGMACETNMQRIMYLAEDRIIGSEIVLGKKRWTLDYCEAARATTDACERAGELQRQRRRWNNSSTACKLWLCGRWLAYLRRADRSVADKVRFTTALWWQLVLVLQQLLAPMVPICTAMLLVQGINGAITRSGMLWPASLLATLGVGISMSWLCAVLPPAGLQRAVCRIRDAAFFVAAIMVVALIAMVLPIESLALLYGPLLVATWLSSRAAADDWFRVMRRAPEYFVLTNPLIKVWLSAYAVTHVHDVTWGTKGLVARSSGRVSMRMVRNAVTLLWLMVNGLMVWAAVNLQPLWFAGLNPVLELLRGLFLMSVIMAAWMSIRSAFANHQAHLLPEYSPPVPAHEVSHEG